MTSEKHEIKKGAEEVGVGVHEELQEEHKALVDKVVEKGIMPKDIMGLSDSMVEGIYGQAYRLYNTGKFEDASQLFRLLIMLNSMEGKYTMGLAACFHMLKEFDKAIETYALCAIVSPDDPVPHYHASDCYIQLDDAPSAIISLELAIKRAEGKPEYQALLDRALLTTESLKKQLNEAAAEAEIKSAE